MEVTMVSGLDLAFKRCLASTCLELSYLIVIKSRLSCYKVRSLREALEAIPIRKERLCEGKLRSPNQQIAPGPPTVNETLLGFSPVLLPGKQSCTADSRETFCSRRTDL